MASETITPGFFFLCVTQHRVRAISSTMTFRSFDSLEDALEAEAEARQEADKRVKPWQAEVKSGDFVIRSSDEGIAVYAEVIDEPVDPDEEAIGPADLGHYRFSKSYSICCVDGELGYFHVCTVVAVLTLEQFSRAWKLGWPTP